MVGSRTAAAVVAAFVMIVVLAAGCGSGDDESGAPEQVELIDLEMVDVASGDAANLADALEGDGDKPTLAWFWAPHCPTCRGEAPELDAFMGENADRVNMVGIGSRDDYELAEDFLADTGVQNFPLLWEDTGESWSNFGVIAQPYLLLIDGDTVVERWPGGVAPEVIDLRLDELSDAA